MCTEERPCVNCFTGKGVCTGGEDGNDNPFYSACHGCYKKSNGMEGGYCLDGLWDYRGREKPILGRHLNRKCSHRLEIEEA